MTNVEHIPARKLYVRKKPQGDHRPKGSQDRFTREIKQTIVDAAEYVGGELTDPENPDAPPGITAYLVHVARNHPQTTCAMLARMMPIQYSDVESAHHLQNLQNPQNLTRGTGFVTRSLIGALSVWPSRSSADGSLTAHHRPSPERLPVLRVLRVQGT